MNIPGEFEIAFQKAEITDELTTGDDQKLQVVYPSNGTNPVTFDKKAGTKEFQTKITKFAKSTDELFVSFQVTSGDKVIGLVTLSLAKAYLSPNTAVQTGGSLIKSDFQQELVSLSYSVKFTPTADSKQTVSQNVTFIISKISASLTFSQKDDKLVSQKLSQKSIFNYRLFIFYSQGPLLLHFPEIRRDLKEKINCRTGQDWQKKKIIQLTLVFIDADKKPFWPDAFEFTLPETETELVFKYFEDDVGDKDEFIGSCNFIITQLKVTQKPLTLQLKSKEDQEVGDMLFTVQKIDHSEPEPPKDPVANKEPVNPNSDPANAQGNQEPSGNVAGGGQEADPIQDPQGNVGGGDQGAEANQDPQGNLGGGGQEPAPNQDPNSSGKGGIDPNGANSGGNQSAAGGGKEATNNNATGGQEANNKPANNSAGKQENQNNVNNNAGGSGNKNTAPNNSGNSETTSSNNQQNLSNSSVAPGGNNKQGTGVVSASQTRSNFYQSQSGFNLNSSFYNTQRLNKVSVFPSVADLKFESSKLYSFSQLERFGTKKIQEPESGLLGNLKGQELLSPVKSFKSEAQFVKQFKHLEVSEKKISRNIEKLKLLERQLQGGGGQLATSSILQPRQIPIEEAQKSREQLMINKYGKNSFNKNVYQLQYGNLRYSQSVHDIKASVRPNFYNNIF